MIRTKVRIPAVAGITPDPDMGAKWVLDLTVNADTMNSRRKARIKNDADFGQLIATQAADKFGPMIAPGFVSKGDLSAENIRTKHRDKLLNSYNKYNDNLDRLLRKRTAFPPNSLRMRWKASSPPGKKVFPRCYG